METRESIAEEPTYERIVYYIEQERCVPLRAEFYRSGEVIAKVLEVDLDAIESHGERFIPMKTTMRDEEKGTHTTVTILKIEPDAEIRDRVFEPAELEKGAR